MGSTFGLGALGEGLSASLCHGVEEWDAQQSSSSPPLCRGAVSPSHIHPLAGRGERAGERRAGLGLDDGLLHARRRRPVALRRHLRSAGPNAHSGLEAFLSRLTPPPSPRLPSLTKLRCPHTLPTRPCPCSPAAANSLSDVYAMGGSPLCALNIAAFPSNRLPIEGPRTALLPTIREFFPFPPSIAVCIGHVHSTTHHGGLVIPGGSEHYSCRPRTPPLSGNSGATRRVHNASKEHRQPGLQSRNNDWARAETRPGISQSPGMSFKQGPTQIHATSLAVSGSVCRTQSKRTWKRKRDNSAHVSRLQRPASHSRQCTWPKDPKTSHHLDVEITSPRAQLGPLAAHTSLNGGQGLSLSLQCLRRSCAGRRRRLPRHAAPSSAATLSTTLSPSSASP